MPDHPWLLLVMASLTAARLTRLITRDVFPPVRWAREWVEDHGPEWLVDLVTCVWCASGWVSIGVVALFWLAPGVATPMLTAGAVWALSSAAAWWQARVEDADEQQPEPEAEDQMATMVTLERQDAPNGAGGY